MNYKKFFYSLILVFVGVLSVTAQKNESVADTIDKNFEEVIKSSNNYQDYKVVKLFKLNDLRKKTHDQIVNLETSIDSLGKEINSFENQIKELNGELEETNTKLARAEQSKDELSLLGLKLQKITYQSVVIVIILLLLSMLILFISKFRASNVGTVKAQNDLSEVQEEYEEYRRKALETQQKLGRQLLDERNKNSGK